MTEVKSLIYYFINFLFSCDPNPESHNPINIFRIFANNFIRIDVTKPISVIFCADNRQSG